MFKAGRAIEEASPASGVEVRAVPEELRRSSNGNPYPYFAWLRDHAPVHRERKRDGLSVVHVSRYSDVRALLSDRRLSKRPELAPAYVAGPSGLNRHLVHADPPDHTRLRGLVNEAFLPRRIAALEPFVRRTAERFIDRLPRSGTFDLIEAFAMPLTFTLICTILGVPEALNTARTRQLLASTVVPGDVAESKDARIARERALYDLLAQLVIHKRRPGSDRAELDLLGALVDARDRGDALTEEELVGTAYILLLVGHDTTVNLIGNGMLALLRHPDQERRLVENPGMMPTAIEELLRYDSPVRDATFRVAVEPVPIHGQEIQPGEIVSLLIGSANRDDEFFYDADRLDLARHPNDHLAFGRGPHFCIGAALARMEGRVAFGSLLNGLGPLQLAVPDMQLQWRPSRVMRGLKHLPVTRARSMVVRIRRQEEK